MTTVDANGARADLGAYALPNLDMLVVFDDGTRMTSHADQRDMRRAQVATGADPDRDPLGYNRAAAWSWLHRTGAIAMGWKEFDNQVAWVIPVPEDEQTAADPTPAATA